MSKIDQKLDDFYRALHEFELLARKYKSLLARENLKVTANETLTAKDIMFSQNKIEQVERELKEVATDLVALGESRKDEFENLIDTKGGLSDIAIEFVFRAMSWNPDVWSSYIERFVVKVLDDYRKNEDKYNRVHLYALLLDLPDQFYLEESTYVAKLVDTMVIEDDPNLVYCLIHFLWKQNYVYPIVIEGLRKNLTNKDWRIRLVTYECLLTWKREYNIRDMTLPTPSMLDRFRALVNKDYEVKLIE